MIDRVLSDSSMSIPMAPGSHGSLKEFQQWLQTLDVEKRAVAEAAYFSNLYRERKHDRHQNDRHVVVLIHGIRTPAEWQEDLRDRLEREGVEAIPIGYQIYKTWRFLCPFFTRSAPAQLVQAEIRQIIADRPGAKISVVAHSFGTYLTCRVLARSPEIKLHRILLCGSVVSYKFKWETVKHRIQGSVLNDAGERDYWPLVAEKVTWGYGATGLFGFKRHGIHDRFTNSGHSDYFHSDHIEKYWVPYLVDGQIVPRDDVRPRRVPRGILFASGLPVRSTALIFLLGVVITLGQHLFHFYP